MFNQSVFQFQFNFAASRIKMVSGHICQRGFSPSGYLVCLS